MSAAEIRSEIDRYLDLVKDESFLKVVQNLCERKGERAYH